MPRRRGIRGSDKFRYRAGRPAPAHLLGGVIDLRSLADRERPRPAHEGYVFGHHWLVPAIARQELLALLRASDDCVASESAQAIEGGAELTVWTNEEVPASHLATIYRRRAEHVRQIDLDVHGIEEAVRRFEAIDRNPVGLAVAKGTDREYVIFLTADGGGLVACLSVPLSLD